jgi:hypothetical protein
VEPAAVSSAPAPAPVPDPAAPPPAKPGMLRDVLRLCAKGLALLAGAAVVLIGFVVYVPDGNDYALATGPKNDRLHMTVPKKIVLVGGSNIAYGLDSAKIHQATGAHVVNMGMNGYLGVRFMLEEVKASLKSPDLVVIALEYDSFYKSVDGTGSDLLMISKNHPSSLSHLSWSQRLEVLKAVPYVGQQKMLRLVRERVQRRKVKLIDKVETASGFNEYGDLTTHLDVVWPFEREDGIDLTKTPMDGQVIGLLQAFAKEMQARNVTVIMSYTSADSGYYGRHKASIDNLHRLLTQSPPLIVPSPPTDFVYPEPLFFDTVYHLNAKGRALRTEKLISDIRRYSK